MVEKSLHPRGDAEAAVTASAVQFGLFDTARAPMLRDAVPRRVAHPLRPYQLTAVRRIRECLTTGASTLLVLPTGTGKTRTGAEFIKEWPGPVLWIAHRTELIDQAREALELVCGELVGTEKAEQRASGTRVVVASVQTLKGDRLERFAQRHPWTLLAIDEAHHAPNETYRAIRRARPDAKTFGLTATPDRSDEKAMGQEFGDVAFVYEIHDAIRDKYLCPIRVKQVLVGAIDLSGVSTVAGDLNQGELDAVMAAEEVIHGIVAPVGRGDSLIELAGSRRTIVFCTSVDMAHRMAEVINRYKPDAARAVDGMTATDTRRQLLRDFDADRYQYLCNVGVLTEGYDSPGVACVAMARPTKSRALYAQCAGRGLRPAPDKEDCLLVDFVGNSGKHELVSGLNILDGKYDDEVVLAARDILEAQGMDGGMLAEDALEQAQRLLDAKKAREAARRARVTTTKVERTVIERDPFALLDVENPEADARIARYRSEATEGQVSFLTKKGVPEPEKLSKRQASALIDRIIDRQRSDKASYKMLAQLKKRGVPNAESLSFVQAKRALDAIAANGWRPLAPAALAAAVERVVGEEG